MSKPTRISDIFPHELSLVTKNGPDGIEYQPRNRSARVLAVKGAPSFLDRLASLLGAKKADPAPEAEGDYAAKAQAVRELFDNVQAALSMTEPESRETALRAALDSHFDGIDLKAGARHSKGDAEKIVAMGKHLKKAKKAVAMAMVAHAGLVPADPADAAEDAADGGADEASEKADPVTIEPVVEKSNIPGHGHDELAVIPEVAEAVADGVEPEEQPAAAILEEPPAVEEVKAEPVDIAAIIKAALAEQSSQLDAKIAATLEPLTAQLAEKSQQVTALEASIKAQAIAKAQERTSPGGNASFNGAGYGQPAILGDVTLEPAPIDPKTSTVRDVIRNRKAA